MDLSAKYIKMCDCPEVQEIKVAPENHAINSVSPYLQDGDYYYSSVEDRVLIAHTEQRKDYIVKHPEQWDYLGNRKIIWLPKQDQIQAKFDWDSVQVKHLDGKARFYVPSFEYPQYEIPGETMEQLWLKFYMYERHNLKWTNGKWEEVE